MHSLWQHSPGAACSVEGYTLGVSVSSSWSHRLQLVSGLHLSSSCPPMGWPKQVSPPPFDLTRNDFWLWQESIRSSHREAATKKCLLETCLQSVINHHNQSSIINHQRCAQSNRVLWSLQLITVKACLFISVCCFFVYFWWIWCIVSHLHPSNLCV